MLLEILTILLLALHLLAMNLASAGPLVCAWLFWRSGSQGLGLQLGRQLAWISVIALLIGMATGGLLILSSPGTGLWLALQRFPANAYWFAAAELVFSLVCMLAMATTARVAPKWVLGLLAFVSATNLLYHFPPFMAVVGQMAADANWTAEQIIDRPILRQLMKRGEVMALSLHFGMSSLAVAGIALLQLLTGRRDEKTAAEAATLARRAAAIALGASLMQVPIGVWLLTSLPADARMALMGNSLIASLAFLAAMVLTIMLLQRLVTIVIGETDRKNLEKVVSLTCGVILLMTISLRQSRPALPGPKAETKTASHEIARG